MSAESAGWVAGKRDAITDIPGIRVGQWTHRRAATGCTVVLCETAACVAVDVRGGAPGTRETDLLAGPNLVRSCHAVLLTGGSAFGLAAADGVMKWLAEREIGFQTSTRKVPIVSAAVIYDLAIGRADLTPDAAAGYFAADHATGGKVAQGSVGAGTGATVAKMLGVEGALKGGVGSASLVGPRGIVVGAIVVNNAGGSLFDPETGGLVAGPRGESGAMFGLAESVARRTERMDALLEHTTLVCVATNAIVEHAALQRVTYLAHDGMARVIHPAHTLGDGDVAFAISMGQVEIQPQDVMSVGILAGKAVEIALLRSVRRAGTLAGIPSVADWQNEPRA